MDIYVSIALRTDVWHQVGRTRHDPGDGAVRAFSSVGLGGTSISKSIVRRRDRPDLGDILRASGAGGSDLCSTTEHSRDIDGSTIVAHWHSGDCISPTWIEVAELADACVLALDEAAATLAVDRVAGGFRPVLDVEDARSRPTALWAHTVLVCAHGGADADHRCGAEEAAQILPSSFEVVTSRDASVYLALHASLVCARTSEMARRTVDLMDELHGWWSASWCLDQTLLATETVLAERLSVHEMPDLAPTADLLAVITTRIGIIRSRLDTLRLGLGGFEWPLWEAAGRRWALEENLASLERKREILTGMTTAFRQALESHHAERLNQLAGFFAIVSSVASFVAVLLFLFPALQDSTGLALRVVLLVLALGTTLAAVFWSSEYMIRANRRARRSGPTAA